MVTLKMFEGFEYTIRLDLIPHLLNLFHDVSTTPDKDKKCCGKVAWNMELDYVCQFSKERKLAECFHCYSQWA